MIKKIFVYILRLLAGKFGTICTEFPLKKFLPKNQNRVLLVFSAKITRTTSRARKIIPFVPNRICLVKTMKFLDFLSHRKIDYGCLFLNFLARDDVSLF